MTPVKLNSRLYSSRIQMMADFVPPASVGAELGVAAGDFSAQLLEACKPSCLYLVDLWDTERYNLKDQVVQRFKGREAVVIAHTDSLSFLAQQDRIGHRLDWVYIDTTHSYKQTLAELVAAHHLTRHTGGLIAGHDYCAGNVNSAAAYGVMKAVEDFCAWRPDWKMAALALADDGYFSYMLSQ